MKTLLLCAAVVAFLVCALLELVASGVGLVVTIIRDVGLALFVASFLPIPA